MTASVGSWIRGSGTVSTRTSRLPCQVRAFIPARLARPRRAKPAPPSALGGHVLHDAYEVALRVGELAERDHAHDLLGPHHALAAEALRLRECLLDVGHGDVERDVAAVALRALADAAADAAVAVRGLVV